MDKHVRALALINIAVGILGLLLAIAILYFGGGRDGLLNISKLERENGGIPFSSMPVAGLYWLSLSIYMIFMALPLAAVGYGLYKLEPWARWVGIAVNGFNILNIPVGTIMGLYAIWVLMDEGVEPLFEDKPGDRD